MTAKQSQFELLIIESDVSFAALLNKECTYGGYRVNVARDGQAGLRMALETQPSLVILDIDLPEEDGLDICRQLHAAGDFPILVLAASRKVSDRILALESGADDYMVKPFSIDELLARVPALLRRRGPQEVTVLRYGNVELDIERREVRHAGRVVQLSARQLDLLEFYLKHPDLVPDEAMDALFEGRDWMAGLLMRRKRDEG